MSSSSTSATATASISTPSSSAVPAHTNHANAAHSTAANDDGQDDDLPRLEALFHVTFDQKIGYTLAWSRVSPLLSGTTSSSSSSTSATSPPTTSSTTRSKPSPDPLSGIEFAALPSGLHTLSSDLIYFTPHLAPATSTSYTSTTFAGLAAYARAEASSNERGARFASVGVLVRREGGGGEGRLGRVWVWAGRLRDVAGRLAAGKSGEEQLQSIWEEWGRRSGEEDEGESSEAREGKQNGSGVGVTKVEEAKKGHTRQRTLSSVSVGPRPYGKEERLAAFHPARAMVRYLEVFGPLMFRLQQAALLRKRILLVGAPPVRRMCEFVYILCVLSSISPRDASLLTPGAEHLLRLPSFFSIGVHDIPSLSPRHPKTHGAHTPDLEPEGWVACTTDEIFATKTHLYDILVEMPPDADEDTDGGEMDVGRQWPRIRTSGGGVIEASQRDVERWKLIMRELWRHRPHSREDDQDANHQQYTDDDDGDDDHDDHKHTHHQDDNDTVPLLSPHPKSKTISHQTTQSIEHTLSSTLDSHPIEAPTWSRLAYQGFMWWASAGERDAFSSAERDADREMLGDVATWSENGGMGVAMGVVGWLHLMTGCLIGGLVDMGQREGGGSEDEGVQESADDDGEGVIVLGRDELSALGVDAWSKSDAAFVQEFAEMYLGRRVEVRGREVECCGLRVPVL